MVHTLRATPLIAVDAVAVDTETTGLDPHKAAVIEIAAIRLHGVEMSADAPFQSLVACDAPIPAASSAIHGLRVSDLIGAPPFADAWRAFSNYIGQRVWIGYAVAFDVTALKRHCQIAHAVWRAPIALDIRLLAQLVDNTLPDYSLETLCAWLNIPIAARHRALADAEIAARIFIALTPRLRLIGIRTVGEALAACKRLSAEHAAHAEEIGDAASLARIDSYPYRHRVGDLMSAPPVFIASSTPLSDAIAIMMERKISSVFVGDETAGAGAAGVLTERDIMRAIASGADKLQAPAARFASAPLISARADEFVYRAIARMNRRRVRHLAVIDDHDQIVGAISARDLLRLRADAAIALGDDIDAARDVPQLGRAWAKLPAMAGALLAEDVDARRIASVVAHEVCALTRKAAIMAEERLRAEGEGGAPCAYVVLALGSAGRGESLLAMDQDNAILFAHGEPGGREDRWFARLGAMMSDTLDEVGVPYCKGGVMASQPAYRGSIDLWSKRVSEWIGRSNPRDLLSVDIFFDFRAAHGDRALAARVWTLAWSAARGQRAFLKLLAQNGEGGENPFGFLGGWRVGPDGRIDLKNVGLRRIVAGARVLALHGGLALHSTHERLSAIAAAAGARDDLLALDRAHETIVDVILRQQLEDIRDGRAPDNRIDPAKLGRERARALKEALSASSVIDELVRDALTD